MKSSEIVFSSDFFKFFYALIESFSIICNFFVISLFPSRFAFIGKIIF